METCIFRLELSDRSGRVNARMWNATESIYRSFENGDYVYVEGTTQIFQGAMQLIVTRLTKMEPSEVNEDDFTPLAAVAVDKLVVRLGEILRGMTNPHLRNLAECFLMDEGFMAKFTRAPAGVKNHHAYLGGLLEHVVNVMEVAAAHRPLLSADRSRLAGDGRFSARPGQGGRTDLRSRSGLQ